MTTESLTIPRRNNPSDARILLAVVAASPGTMNMEEMYRMLKVASRAINRYRNPASLAVFWIEFILRSFVRRCPVLFVAGHHTAADFHGDVFDHRVHGRTLGLVLRGHADAAGDGPGRLDVRRHRSLHRSRGQRRSGGSWSGIPLRLRRALAAAEPHRLTRGLRGLLPTPLPRHAGRSRSFRRAEVRSRGTVPPRHARSLEGERESPEQRTGPHRGLQGVRGDHGAIHLRPLREVPGYGAEHLRFDLPAGSPAGAGVLRPPLRSRGLPANPRRPHGPLAWRLQGVANLTLVGSERRGSVYAE